MIGFSAGWRSRPWTPVTIMVVTILGFTRTVAFAQVQYGGTNRWWHVCKLAVLTSKSSVTHGPKEKMLTRICSLRESWFDVLPRLQPTLPFPPTRSYHHKGRWPFIMLLPRLQHMRRFLRGCSDPFWLLRDLQATMLNVSDVLNRFWILATWRNPWRGAQPIHFSAPMAEKDTVRTVSRFYGLLLLCALPLELLEMIRHYGYSRHSLLWRCISAF